MLKAFGISFVVCSLLAAGGMANAQPGDSPNRGNQRPGWGQQLTPQQRQQAERIFNENFSSMDQTRNELALKRDELNAELESSNPNRAKIESLSREIGELRGKMLNARLNARSQMLKEGLPDDYYGPDVPSRRTWHRGPEVWRGGHHGRRHHYRDYRGGYCGGCWW